MYTELMNSNSPDLASERTDLEQPLVSPVDYDGPPVVELTVDDVDYRLDAGKQGTALSVSSRPTGTWQWAFGGEVRWNGSSLRSRTMERSLLDRLAKALVEAVADMD
jgi:hypothetical protein